MAGAPNIFEARILKEVERCNEIIKEAAAEKRALERLLMRLRQEEIVSHEVGRKNSGRRMLVERAVINRLVDAKGRAVPVNALWSAANSVVPDLKDVTFRTHLHRMKEKGLIVPSKLHGRWRLPDDQITVVTDEASPNP